MIGYIYQQRKSPCSVVSLSQTFYLLIQYTLQYQSGDKETKQVKSKLVHGSIMENEGKNLLLPLKVKSPPLQNQINLIQQNQSQILLNKLQFKLVRVFQTSKQGKPLCQQSISNPQVNKEYSLDFYDEKVEGFGKQKPMGTMIFQLYPAINEQPLAKRIEHQQDQQYDEESQIPQNITENKNSARQRYENYTLGVPAQGQAKTINRNNNNRNPSQTRQRNIFDSEQQQQEEKQRPPTYGQKINNYSQSMTHRQKYHQELQQTNENIVGQKFNDLSQIGDENLSRQKIDDTEQRQYVINDTSLFIGNQTKEKIKSSNKNQSSNNNLSGVSDSRRSMVKQKPNAKLQNQYTHIEREGQQQSRYEYNTTNQRENYLSQLQYSKYTHQDTLLKGSSRMNINVVNSPPKNQVKNEDKNFKKNKINQISSNDQLNKNLSHHIINNNSPQQKFTKQPDLKQKSKNLQTSQVNSNKLLTPQFKDKKLQQSLSKSNNDKKQLSPYSTQMQNEKDDLSQNTSRWQPQNLPDLDSSDIRYKFDDNDISNIEETKNMQELINQIETIERQWYEKRVLKRKQTKKQNDLNLNSSKIEVKPLRRQQENQISVQLRKFKIKLDENTFYNKLINNLKAKHLANKESSVQAVKNPSFVSKDHQKQQFYKDSKDYIVYLIAHQVDEQQIIGPQTEISEKIQIKIPSIQIQDLIFSQNQQEQLKKKNQAKIDAQQAIVKPQNIRKKIIKDFQKQLYSKVMKIKIFNDQQNDLNKNKPDSAKDKLNDKPKTKIIQIALEEQVFVNNTSLQSKKQQITSFQNKNNLNKKATDLNQNRISLIGMYPLPIFSKQNKDQQGSFYQNLSNQSLSINMYNKKNGNQEGKFCFELKKGKIDKQIQTFQPLVDLNGLNLKKQITKNQRKQTIGVNKNVQKTQLGKKNTLNVQIKGKPIKPQQSNGRNMSINDKKLTKKEKELKLSLDLLQNDEQTQRRTTLKKNSRSKNHESYQKRNSIRQPEESKVDNTKQYLEQQIVLKKPKNILPDNNKPITIQNNLKERISRLSKFSAQYGRGQKILESPYAGKIIKNTTHRSLISDQKRERKTNLSSYVNRIVSSPKKINEDSSPERLKNISVRLPSSQRLFQMSNSQQEINYNESPSGNKNRESPSKNNIRIKTEEITRENAKSEFKRSRQQSRLQGSQSYRLMKHQLQETAGLLENLKMKAQDFINQVQRQKESKNTQSPNKDFSQEKASVNINYENTHKIRKDGIEDLKKFQSPLNTQKRLINLQVSSSVISQTILSRKKNQPHSPFVNKRPVPLQSDHKTDNSLYDQRETPQIRHQNTSPSKSIIQKIKRPIHIKDANQYNLDTSLYDIPKQVQIKQKHHERHPHNKRSVQIFNKQKLITLSLYSMKIKLINLNDSIKNNPPGSKSTSKHIQNCQYFVLVSTDFNKQSHLNSNNQQQLPFVEKCYRSSEATDDNLYVQFINKDIKKGNIAEKNSCFKLIGKQSSHLKIQLFQSSRQTVYNDMKNEYTKYFIEDENKIGLVTSSNKKVKSQGLIGSVSVTYLQLMAQDSFSFNEKTESLHNIKLNLINYTNFLYKGDKIMGKLNINYEMDQWSNSQDRIIDGKNELPHVILNSPSSSIARKNFTTIVNKNYPDKLSNNQEDFYNLKNSNRVTQKYTNQFQFRNSLLQRYNQNLSLFDQKSHDFKQMRSESGMTQKVTPKRKKNKPKYHQQTEPNSHNSRLVDPLEILKRKGPKPLKSHQKTKSYSHSYHVRLNRPYQTPMNKRVNNKFDSLNSSQSLHFKRQKTTQPYPINKKQDLPSSYVQIQSALFQQSPMGSEIRMQSATKQDASHLKRKKNPKQMKANNIQSRIYPTEETRLTQNRRYDGGNIKFGKSSRFNYVSDSPQLGKNNLKEEVPGPGYYQVKSIFDRHLIKQP